MTGENEDCCCSSALAVASATARRARAEAEREDESCGESEYYQNLQAFDAVIVLFQRKVRARLNGCEVSLGGSVINNTPDDR